MTTAIALLAAILLTYIPCSTHAHGRMLDPPSRMSAWRFGFDVPKNYDDNAQYCGGFGNQWGANNGKCGICGDPWQGPRDYERPNGKKVPNLVITRTYKQGATIDVHIEVTANHLGWFEFHICDVRQSGGVEATHECLARHIIADRTGKTRFEIGSKVGLIRFRMVLPPTLTCPQCVLQWKWHCGNNVGYGERQEEFYACSDVSITATGIPIPTTPAPMTPRPIVTVPSITPRPIVTAPPIYPVNPTTTRRPHTTLPPDLLIKIGDQTQPLTQRILLYVAYQKTHNQGYSIWDANTILYKPRGGSASTHYATSNNNNNYNGNGYGSNLRLGGSYGNTPQPSDSKYNRQATEIFCKSCKLGCAYDDCTKLCPVECPVG